VTIKSDDFGRFANLRQNLSDWCILYGWKIRLNTGGIGGLIVSVSQKWFP
jgi:hypothetical protein